MQKDNKRKVGFPLRVDPQKKAQIQEAAKKKGVSENAYINEIVDRDLAAKAKAAKKQQEIETIEQQLNEKFAELEVVVGKSFKHDAIDRAYSNPEVLGQRVTEEANYLWRNGAAGTKGQSLEAR
jgi:hypothetical protein